MCFISEYGAQDKIVSFYVIQNSTRVLTSDVIRRDSLPSDFLFSAEKIPGVSLVPRLRRLILLYRARDDDDVDGTANVPGTLFSVPDTSCPILPLSLSVCLTVSPSRVRTNGCCIRSDRGTERTNERRVRRPERRGPTRRVYSRTARYNVIRMRSSAPWVRLIAKHGPTDTAVIHLAAGFRDSLTFLRIGPCRRRAMRPGRLQCCTWPHLCLLRLGADRTLLCLQVGSFISTDKEFDVI